MNSPLASKAELAAFRKLDRTEQLRALRGLKLERSFALDRAGIDKEARTAWFAIASEEPYERWWGVEILDCQPESIRTQRLDMGAPFLVGHDTCDMVGVVERYEISPDKKLRILVRFSKSERGEEIWQDVLDGIRRNTSVGYIIHDLILEKQEEDVCFYRVTDWEPLEGSTVPVPADPTVGLGRALEHARQSSAVPPETPVNQRKDIMDPKDITPEVRAQIAAEERAKLEREAAERAAAQANTPEAILARERDRVSALLQAGTEYRDLGGEAVAAELIKDASGTLDAFKARMLEKMRGRQTPSQTAQPADRPVAYGQSARNIVFSGKLRGFKDLEFADGSRLTAQEAAYRSGQWALAVVYGNERSARWCRDQGLGGHLENRAATEGTGTGGGFLVPVEMESAIIDLRVQYGVARRIARYTPMGSGSLERPRRASGITAYFSGDTASATASDKGWDKVRLNAKLLNALGKMSTAVVEDAVIDLAMDMADEQAYAFATKEDQCFFVGDGTSTYGGIRGINTIFEANTSYKGFGIAASGHDTWPEMDNSDTTAVIGLLPSYARVGARWVISPMGEASVFGRLKATAGGNSVNTLRDGVVESDYLGYPVTLAEGMPSGTGSTDYSNKVMALFGNFQRGVMFGERRGITVQILRELYAADNQIGVMSTERIDIVVHDLGDTSTAGPIVALAGQ